MIKGFVGRGGNGREARRVSAGSSPVRESTWTTAPPGSSRGDFTSREDPGTRITAFTIRHDKRARPCKWSYDADAEHARYLERHPQPEPQTALPEAA